MNGNIDLGRIAGVRVRIHWSLLVVFTLIVNLLRGYPLLSMAATVLIAAGLYWRWVRAGKPAGLERIEREAEAET